MGPSVGRHICHGLAPGRGGGHTSGADAAAALAPPANRGSAPGPPASPKGTGLGRRAASPVIGACTVGGAAGSGARRWSAAKGRAAPQAGLHGREVVPKLKEEDFEFLRCIGQGTFGRVYLVRKRGDEAGRLLAMKVLRKCKVADTRRRAEYIITERKVLRTARHPFVARLRYAFQSPSQLYLVTDYLGGGELLEHLRREGRFTEAQASFFTAEVSLGLEYLHGKGICHRDLKPENVLLDEEGHVRLTDFGLSKMGLQGPKTTSTICGTPEYLPPEVFRNQSYACELDWWSMGVLLFEMLEGGPPFRDSNEQRLFHLIVAGSFDFKLEHSADAESLVRELLQPERAKRLTAAAGVKAHPWFAAMDWQLAASRGLEPPFRPGALHAGSAPPPPALSPCRVDPMAISLKRWWSSTRRPSWSDDGCGGLHISGFTYNEDRSGSIRELTLADAQTPY